MRLGQHETTGGRLHRLGFVSMYQVGDDQARLIAKVVESDGLPADEMLKQASDDLLAAANLQRAAEDGPGIARVIDISQYQDRGFGATTQAYAIYQRFDDNARQLLGPRSRPDAATVLDLLEQLRAALAGFAAATARPHGHATLSNILINAAHESKGPVVALTDPLPAIADPHRAAQADRRALGGFLLAMVTGRSAESLRSVEVPPDRDWVSVFGSVGASNARGLCQELLFDGSTALPVPETLEQALRYRQGPINSKSIAAVAAAVLLLIAGGIAWMLTRPPAAPTAQLSDAAAALARYPTNFRRFVQAQDPASPDYQRLSDFIVLLSQDPWDEALSHRPPTGPGTVHAIYREIQQANQTLTTSQLGRSSTALEGLWRSIAITPDEAPLARWDAVARSMLASGQDETSRSAQFMFGAIKTMADDFDEAGQAATAFTEAQRARLSRVREAIEQRGIVAPLDSLALMEARIAAVDAQLTAFLAPREAAAPAGTSLPVPEPDADPAEAREPSESDEPDSPSDASGEAAAPGLPSLTRVDIAELFDAALALEHLLGALEAGVGRSSDLGEPIQIVQGLRSDSFTALAPPAYRADAKPIMEHIAASLLRDYDQAVHSDLEQLLSQRARQDRWDTTIDYAWQFKHAADIRRQAKAITERLRSTGVVAELGWMASDGLIDAPSRDWPAPVWTELLAQPRFQADPTLYSIEAHLEQTERWEQDLRAADETNDPRYAPLRQLTESALHSPQQQRAYAHWPTPERHRVVAAAYDDLLERVEVAVRVLDPCYPLKAAFIPKTLAEVRQRFASGIEGVDEETEALIAQIIATVDQRDEVRADRSTQPSHPRVECANAARFAERLEALLVQLREERARSGSSGSQAWADRAARVYHAGLRQAWFNTAEASPTQWTASLASRMFAEQSPAGTNWAEPEAIAGFVRTMAQQQEALHAALRNWAWADAEGFAAIQSLMDAIDHTNAAASGASPSVAIDAARDEAWDRDRIAAARLLAAEHWLCSDHPSEQAFRRAIIAGALPEEVMSSDLQGNWLRDDAEFAFLWVRRRNGCPVEPWPVPESSYELLDTAKLIEVMQNAIQAAPIDASRSFPELEELPERLRTEGLFAAAGFATNHMTPEDWRHLAQLDNAAAEAQRQAFRQLGMPLEAEAGSLWFEPKADSPPISARVRANWALWDAITKLQSPENAEETRARAVVDELVSRWSVLAREEGGSDGYLAERARAMAMLPGQLAARPPDFTLPGALPQGWHAVQADANWGAVDVTIPGFGVHRFIGARTGRTSGYPTAYIAREELSIHMVNALLAALPAGVREEKVRGLEEVAAQSRSLLGPVGWTMQGGKAVPADAVSRGNEVENALDGALSSHGWFSLLPRRDGSFASLAARQPALPGVGAPTAQTPVQMVPADFMIGLLSAVPVNRPMRLPTLSEWSQLAGSYTGGAGSLSLRDRSFQRALQAEVEFFDQNAESARFVSTFRMGRTARDGAERVLPHAASRELGHPLASDSDDGHALFMPVDQGGWVSGGDEPGRLRHAYGNVAEIVATPGQEQTHAAVGGSALSLRSDFGESLTDGIPMRSRDLNRPFADAGFRIAFDAPEGQPFAQVALERLMGFGFLSPMAGR